jgi:hypothetical protein
LLPLVTSVKNSSSLAPLLAAVGGNEKGRQSVDCGTRNASE